MSKGAFNPEMRKRIYKLYGMEDKELVPKTEEERARFWRHFEETKAEILSGVKAKEKSQSGPEDT